LRAPHRFHFLLLLACLTCRVWAAGSTPAEPARPAGFPAWFGPAFTDFGLTLRPGTGTEAFGPLWGTSDSEGEHLWRLSPLVIRLTDPSLERDEWNFLYPAIGYRRYGTEWKLHILQFLSFAGGQTVDGEFKERTTLFPFYFRQESTRATNDYHALLPFYGHIQNRLFRSEINFVLLPLYVQSKKKDFVTDNYLLPFFHRRYGPTVQGWQFWPLIGAEHRAISWRTNTLDEREVVPGHERRFLLWPIGFSDRLELGSANPTTNLFIFPAYLRTRSPQQDHTWIAGFSYRTNRATNFEEWAYPWPFLGHARGPGKQVQRVFPLWGRAKGGALESDFVLWPLYTRKRLHSDPLDRERRRFLFVAYDDLRESDTATGRSFRRRSLWPLFTWRHELDGRERLQVLAPVESLVSHNTNVERIYSPMWSIWRSERNPATRQAHQSLLWNLWRRETRPDETRTSLLMGAVRTVRTSAGTSWSWFGLGGTRPSVAQAGTPSSAPAFAHRGPELRRLPAVQRELAGGPK
jgi:hypothetical protein